MIVTPKADTEASARRIPIDHQGKKKKVIKADQITRTMSGDAQHAELQKLVARAKSGDIQLPIISKNISPRLDEKNYSPSQPRPQEETIATKSKSRFL